MTTRIMARFNSRSKSGEPFPKTPTFRFLKTGAENEPTTPSFACWMSNHDGVLSAEEKARARIILFGHSWGASAAVLLARDLRREGVPVLLTVQVDSVAKVWQNDSVIPDNVAEAVNFYQPHGFIHGRARITAADPAKTEILGNYRTDYKKNPVVVPRSIPGRTASLPPATCRASAIPTSGRRSKTWCGSGYLLCNPQPRRHPQP